jgi:tripartite-type tricarboxylate transporter receptor subunit TctC
MKRQFSKIGLLVLVISCSFLMQSFDLANCQDSDYPNKPINFLIMYGAGGTSDLSYRAFLRSAEKYLGNSQTFLPINKPGGSGLVSASAVMNSPPDGYTLGGFGVVLSCIAPMLPDSPYKNMEPFTLLANIGDIVHAVTVKNDARWKTWKELVSWAKENPGKLKVGITGSKETNLLAIYLFQVEEKEKIQFSYVTFKSSAEILVATMGGHIDIFGSTLDSSLASYIEKGDLRVIAYGDKTIEGYKNAPTLRSLYNLDALPNIAGIWGPKGLPEQVVKKLDNIFEKAARDPEFVNFMKNFYMEAKYQNSTETKKYVQESTKSLSKVVEKMIASAQEKK